MKASALALSMVLFLVPLAGCSGTDTEVNVDLSNEEINDLIDDNLEDVMNNTTVVIFQEYYNNTTNFNNNTTNVDESGKSTSSTVYNYNGTTGESGLNVIRIEWDAQDILPEVIPKREGNFTVEFSYYDYPTNDDRTDTFTLPCSNYYDAPNVAQTNGSDVSISYWDSNGDIQDDYQDWWDYLYNNTIRDLLIEMAYNGDVENACRESSDNMIFDNSVYRVEYGDEYWQYVYDYSDSFSFLEIMIENGTAINVIEVQSSHRYTDYRGINRPTWLQWTVNGHYQEYDSSNYHYDLCPVVNWADDSNHCGQYYGGWDDLLLNFQLTSSIYSDSEFSFTIYYEIVPANSV